MQNEVLTYMCVLFPENLEELVLKCAYERDAQNIGQISQDKPFRNFLAPIFNINSNKICSSMHKWRCESLGHFSATTRAICAKNKQIIYKWGTISSW